MFRRIKPCWHCQDEDWETENKNKYEYNNIIYKIDDISEYGYYHIWP